MDVFVGVVSAFFFSFTFIFNEVMGVSGGHWLYTASLRFLWTILLLGALMVVLRIDFRKGLRHIRRAPWEWFLYSQIGFVLFYMPICLASTFSPGWLVASTWQLTIVCGTVLAAMSPRTRHQVESQEFLPFVVILIGAFLIQGVSATILGMETVILGVGLILIACFAYPLGNRRIIALTGPEGLDAFSRVFWMSVMSLPSWILGAAIAWVQVGPPSSSQLLQTFLVALLSGVVATSLFFYATQKAAYHLPRLAAVEATQAFEAVFTLILSVLVLRSPLPTPLQLLGIFLVVFGVVAKSLLTSKKSTSL